MRKFWLLLALSSLPGCLLFMVAHAAFAAAPAREFSSSRGGSLLAPAITSPTPTSGPCIFVGHSTCSPLIPTDSPVLYSYQQGMTIQIEGQGWTKNAAITLYLVPVPGTSAPNAAGSALCPSDQQTLTTMSAARSRQAMIDGSGNFTIQLTLSYALKVKPYIVCASVTSSSQTVITLLFQLTVTSNPQEQATGSPAPNGTRPFPLNLSMIALVLALLALLLYIFSPRRQDAIHRVPTIPPERKNAS